jgi:hypothetical protein
MDKNFFDKINESNSIPDIFEIVKEVVWKAIQRSRAGLELGLSELGSHPQGLLGAFYVSGSNMIVMNQTPLRRIQETDPRLLNPYIFSILLHEYIHSLGFFDEDYVRRLTYEISRETFGEKNVITELTKDLRKFFPNLCYPEGSPRIDGPVRKVKGFDRSSIRYIG